MTTRAAANGKVERPATNKGTYESLVNSQRKTRAEYYTTASLINIALFSQIIIAAAVTAVSAAGGPRVAVTVLGALNTVLAGSLTWVKGQGLPDRLLSYANELRRVREHIEDLERQYEEKPDFVLDVDLEAKKIYTMYDNARKNAENAYVGTFQKLGADALKGDWRSTKNRPDGSGPGSGGNSSGATGANGAIAQQTVARV
jgi:SMODS and SLOG-associating 2TM effector domain